MLSKLLLMSIIFAMILIPTRAAREPNAEMGLRKALKQMFVFNLVYLVILLFIYGRV